MGNSLAIKVINIIFYVIAAISIVVGVIFFAGGKDGEVLIIWMYILTALAIGVTMLFAFVNMFKSKKSLIASLVTIGAFGILTIISYLMASNNDILNAAGEVIASGTVSQWAGAGIYMLYILLGMAFVSLIYTEIRAAFN
jgi:hypothetical protein